MPNTLHVGAIASIGPCGIEIAEQLSTVLRLLKLQSDRVELKLVAGDFTTTPGVRFNRTVWN